MPREKVSIEKALLKKGFKKETGDHVYYVYYTLEGIMTNVFTKTSHSPKMKDISDDLLSQMAKQCHLTKHDFLKLVDCPLDREQYEQLLSLNGHI